MHAVLRRLWGENRRRGDTLLACGLLGFSGLVVREANRLPPPFFDPLGSAAAPRLVAGLLSLLGLILVIRWIMTPLHTMPDPVDGSLRATPVSALAIVVAPIVYLLLMQFELLGFAPASTLLIIALAAILGRARRPVMIVSVPLAVVASFGLNALLTRFFFIDLPQRSFWTGAI